MNYYNVLLYLYKTYTLYNNVYYNYNLYLVSLFLNPCITYFLKQRGKKTNTIIYVFDNAQNKLIENDKEKLTNNKQDDSFKIEIIEDNSINELENFTIIEKF